MDFDIVVRQIFKAYKTGSYRWDYPDFVKVFERFYTMYFEAMGQSHPHLRTETIGRVMTLLTEDVNGMYYIPDDYLDSDIFECYFRTEFSPLAITAYVILFLEMYGISKPLRRYNEP